MIRFTPVLVAVALLATGCASLTDGHPSAAPGSSVASGFPNQPGSSTAAGPSPSSTSWVPYSDPVTKVRFQLPGTVSVIVAADQTSDGIPLTRRSYRYVDITGMVVSVSTTSPLDPGRNIVWSLDKYVQDLPANVGDSGFTGVQVVEKKSITMDGHAGVQFRVLAKSSISGDMSAWLVRAVADGSLLAIMQVVYVEPDAAEQLANMRAEHARLVSTVRLP